MGKTDQIRLKDIAAEAKVSIPTVSRFLNGTTIRPDAEERIKKVLKTKNWSRYSTFRLEQKMSDAPHVIAMIVPDIQHNYYSTIVAGTLEEAQKRNLTIMLASCEGSYSKECELLAQFAKSHIDGLIYVPVASWSCAIPQEISLFDSLPLVVAARRAVLKGRPHVYTDNISGGYLATRYMLNLGHRRIGFIVGTWEYPFGNTDLRELVRDETKLGGFASLDRLRGYLKAMEEYKVPYNPDLVTVSHWSFEGGKSGMAELMGRTTDIDAVIATSDTMASGVIDTLKTHGFSIPEDISVLGWDNSELSRFTDPQLTSVGQPSKQMGRNALNMVADLAEGKKVNDIVYEVNIVPRASTSIRRLTSQPS
ncbi:MAG: LacI family DNA-binding transcriptional regulator [Sphaerochaetaceae bacterium]